jgi:ADP-heptose:LPS heptosyltransferase
MAADFTACPQVCQHYCEAARPLKEKQRIHWRFGLSTIAKDATVFDIGQVGAEDRMDVDTMRRIDRLAGVPLCALSTLAVRGLRKLRGRRPGPPRNILFIELSEMGSAILVDPALRAARAMGADLHFAIFEKNRASLDLLGTVPPDNVFTIRPDSVGRLAADTLRFLAWCRRRRIDTVVDLELFSRYTALLAGWSGADRVVGFHRFHNEGLYRGEMLTARVQYNPHVHIARNFFSLVHAAWAEGDEAPFAKIRTAERDLALAKADISPDSVGAVEAMLEGVAPGGAKRPLVLVNANASDLLPQRRWERARYAELAKRVLARRPDALVLLTGAPGERAGLDELAAAVADPRCVNVAGRLAFRDLVALYDRALVMVSNDSGPAHFAATTRMPTVVLFGPETPALYGSLGPGAALFAGLHCSPCVTAWNHRKTPCSDAACLRAIGVDAVFDAMLPWLDVRD